MTQPTGSATPGAPAETNPDRTTDPDHTPGTPPDTTPDQGGNDPGSGDPPEVVSTTTPPPPATDTHRAPATPPPARSSSGGTTGSEQPAGNRDGDVGSLPSWAQKLIRDVRAEAAGSRTKARDAEARHQQMLDAIATALGLKESQDSERDPAKLTELLGTSQAEARMLKVERALDRAARKHGADEELLVAWLAHTGKLADLDPTAEEFASQVDTLVADAVEANPKLRAATPERPARSGAEFTGAPGEPVPARTGAMSIDEHRSERRKRRSVT